MSIYMYISKFSELQKNARARAGRFYCSFILGENWSAQDCLDYVSPVLFYFEFCEILKTFSHISASRGLLFDDTSEQSVCVIREQITEKFARKASRSLDRYIPV